MIGRQRRTPAGPQTLPAIRPPGRRIGGPAAPSPAGAQRRFVPKANPNDLLEQGSSDGSPRNPMEHQAWWAQHGWSLNGQGAFVNPAGHAPPGRQFPNGGINPNGGQGNSPNRNGIHQQTGGASPAVFHDGKGGQAPHGGMPRHGQNVPGRRTGGGNGPGGPGGQGHGKPGLPLDPYFEAQRRLLDDQLQAQLSQLGPAREQLLASENLANTRLGTNEGYDTENLLNQMAARGIYGSGIQAHDQGVQATDYMRSRQDLANQTAQGLGDIASQRAAAKGSYQSGLMELLLELAKRSSQDPYAVASMGGRRT